MSIHTPVRMYITKIVKRSVRFVAVGAIMQQQLLQQRHHDFNNDELTE